MLYFNMPGTGLKAARIALGCMRLGEKSPEEVDAYLRAALEAGYNFFDHADIYGGGKCEQVFGDGLKRLGIKREDVLIQSKCGIRPGRYDFSYEHIMSAVNGSLQRLGVDYLDMLLLHRPDTLMEPEEVAKAFDELQASGKVRYFGVSNQNSMQMQLLQKYVNQKLVANQLQFSPTNTTMIQSGINVNMEHGPAIDRDGSILEYCRLNDITIQPWSPFQYGFFEGLYLGNEKFPELNAAINELAELYGVTPSAIVIAWILRHPAKMQPIVGSVSAKRIGEIAKAADITLTREQWYQIYRAAGNKIP